MATYYVWSGATGLANGSSWTDAYTSLDALFTGQAIAGGDSILMASDHDNGSYAASKTFTFPESGMSTSSHVHLISTNRTSNLPEIGAIEQTNGDFSITVYGRINAYGVTFKTGSGTSQASTDIRIGSSSSTSYGKQIFTKCNFSVNSTSVSGSIILGTTLSKINYVELNNCDFSFLVSGQEFNINHVYAEFNGCTLSGTPISNCFSALARFAKINLNGCDFSSASNLTDSQDDSKVDILAINSFLPANITASSISQAGVFDVELHSCGSTDHSYFYKKMVQEGVVDHDVAVYLTSGGAMHKDSDGSSVPYSLKLTGATNTYNCSTSNPLYTPWFHVPVFSTGSKTFSIKVAHEQAAVLKDNEVWMEVEYMGGTATVNTPQTVREITAPLITGTVFQDYRAAGSNLTDTAEAWTGLASEKTHTLSKTVTVDEQGYARVRVALAVNNISVYVNPSVAVA
jgi:uncharacterized protein YjbI with pentapeptide repeats